jgi:hypothetical protein
MSIHAAINPHPNNMDFGNLYQPFDHLSKDRVLPSKQPWGEAHLKRQIMNFSLVFLWLILLPVRAIADQCVEGDCVNGKGTMIYSTGHKYVGEFEEGKRHGQGIIYMPGGRTVEGQFRQNAPIKGTYTYPNGQVYTGTWEFYESNGQGTLKYSDGRIYEGEFKSGLRNGQGVITWPDGRRYEGWFVRGKRTGEGIMTYPDGRVYKGDFLDGERSGRGVMTLPNGERLEGQFADGKYVVP